MHKLKKCFCLASCFTVARTTHTAIKF